MNMCTLQEFCDKLNKTGYMIGSENWSVDQEETIYSDTLTVVFESFYCTEQSLEKVKSLHIPGREISVKYDADECILDVEVIFNHSTVLPDVFSLFGKICVLTGNGGGISEFSCVGENKIIASLDTYI